MSDRLFIFDTTLRDGEQVPGCQLNTVEKIQVAKALEVLGVDVIEAGFPISSPGDFNSVIEISKAVTWPTICALTRAVQKDIDVAVDALKFAKHKRIHTAGRINLLSIDIRLNINLVMALNNHCYLFKGCISGTFTDTVNGNFYLTGTVQYTGHRVGSSHSQVIMTMGRNNRILYTCYMIYQIFNFRSIL
jgi:hypothetical protein